MIKRFSSSTCANEINSSQDNRVLQKNREEEGEKNENTNVDKKVNYVGKYIYSSHW